MNNTTSKIKAMSAIGTGRKFEDIKYAVVVCLCVSAAFTIIANALQLWCLNKKFRREVNTLFVIVKHLSIADLIQGIQVLIMAILVILQMTSFRETTASSYVIQFNQMFNNFYIHPVTLITLDCLTLLKMLKITYNSWTGKATVKRICYCVWGILFIPEH